MPVRCSVNVSVVPKIRYVEADAGWGGWGERLTGRNGSLGRRLKYTDNPRTSYHTR